MYSSGPRQPQEAFLAPESRQQLTLSRGANSRAPVARLMGLPGGPQGTIATLRIMKKLARDSVRAPDQMVRQRALDIYRAAGVDNRAAWLGQAQALQKFVQNCIAYIRDPVDVELVQTPEVTLRLAAGDCDDQSTLLAAMLTATGHPSRFVAVGMNGQPFSHVLVETKIGEKWCAAETIIKKPFGWYPEGVTSRYKLDV